MSRAAALEYYLSALKKEREAYLYQHALNKVRVITKNMKEAEREEYFRSQSFRNTLQQIQKKDKIYRALEQKELPLSWQRAEFDRLAPAIQAEMAAGRKPDLDFLRSAEKAKVAPEKARLAMKRLEDGSVRKFFRNRAEQFTDEAEEKTEQYLRGGDLRSMVRKDRRVRDVPAALMETVFRRGIPAAVLTQAYHPGSLSRSMQNALLKAYPELGSCRSVTVREGTTVHDAVRQEVRRAEAMATASLRRRFPAKRLRKLLGNNESLRRLQKQADEAVNRERELRSALLNAIPEHYRDLYPLARQMKRKFVLHLGPTNSGKTYEGVERLKGARNGIYLGPLRLLAAEQFEALNLADVPCSLVTGEEQIRVPGSRVQSSTVEMADLKTRYDVAVIDECQMIADRDRGGAWTAAILGLCAEEIHACASPDAGPLLSRIIEECGDELEIVRHERMTPLEVEKEGFEFPGSVRPGDALIVFSKARVHAVAAELKSKGYRVSLIYGALPPDVRRNQAERFHRGETEVVVSTDAIAMGMNLPIERVVFLESEKYDGDITRTLTDAEIKQIAGRAGRYGIYETGYVNAYCFKGLVEQALKRPLLPLTEAVIRFPESLLGIPLPLTQIINQWLSMQDKSCFSKASTARMASLAVMMETRNTDKNLLYRFLCIPFDETDPDLLARWKSLYHAECVREHENVLPLLPPLRIPEECTIQTLDTLEADYRRCDLYYNYVRLFTENPDPVLEEIQRRKDLISQGIVHILSTQKLQQKTCKGCKKHLPWNWPYPLCDSCFYRARR